MAENIHFHQSQGLDGVHVEVGGRPTGGGEKEGRKIGYRRAGENHAAGMCFWMTGKTVKTSGQLHGEGVGIFADREVGAFAAFSDGGGQVTGADAGDAFGEAPDLELRDAEGLGDFGEGGTGLVGGEAADDSAVVRPMAAEEDPDDLLPAVVGKVDVDIRKFVHGHAVAVEEAAEVKVETDGADTGDAEAVADEGIGGGAAGDPVDSQSAALLQKIPDEEEVVGVADLADDPEFLGELPQDPAVQGGVGAVAGPGTVKNEAAEKDGR